MMMLLTALLLSGLQSGLGRRQRECCPHIEVTSEGEAARQQPQRLGVYSARDRGWADRPIYKHRQSSDFLFYLQSKSKGLWMVGPKVGNFDGGLASPADDICPHDVADGQWRFTDGKVWRKDKLLQVKCLDNYQPEDDEINKNEVNGKFKIMNLKWDDRLRNPKSLKYKTLANTIEGDIMTMLTEKDDLSHQADFTVSVERFKKGSVIVNFKIDYSLKHAVLAIPFELKPENITDTLAKDFQFQNGILFSRFAIAANSFNGTIYRDQCSVRGCSHKCSYDYDVEDYLCTCPRSLLLHSDNKTCNQSELEEISTTGETVPLPNITTEGSDAVDLVMDTTEVSNKEDFTDSTQAVKITEKDDDGTTKSIEDEITDITSEPPVTTTPTTQSYKEETTDVTPDTSDVTSSSSDPPPMTTTDVTEQSSEKLVETTSQESVFDDKLTTTSSSVLTTEALNDKVVDVESVTEAITEANIPTTTQEGEEIEVGVTVTESTTTNQALTDIVTTTEAVEVEEGDFENSGEDIETFVLEITTERVIIRDEGATADLVSTTAAPTTIASTRQDTETELSTETATQISMEVTDDHNAVIDISGVYRLVCNVKEEEKIDLNCEEMEGSGRRVHLLIDKKNVRGDISKIWQDNVRLIVDSLLVEDISPK